MTKPKQKGLIALPWVELTYSFHHLFCPWQQARPGQAKTATTDLAAHFGQSHPFMPKSGPKIWQNRQPKPATQPTRVHPKFLSPSRAAAPAPPRPPAFPNLPPPSPSTPLAAPTRASACASRRSPSRHLRPRRPPRRRGSRSRGRSGGSCTCSTCPGPSPRRRSRSSSRSSAPSRASR
jgi:hypothetical protein